MAVVIEPRPDDRVVVVTVAGLGIDDVIARPFNSHDARVVPADIDLAVTVQRGGQYP